MGVINTKVITHREATNCECLAKFKIKLPFRFGSSNCLRNSTTFFVQTHRVALMSSDLLYDPNKGARQNEETYRLQSKVSGLVVRKESGNIKQSFIYKNNQ